MTFEVQQSKLHEHKLSRSSSIYSRALKVMPGGNSRDTIYYSPHPIYAESGSGAKIIDIDGIERIDFINNYSSLIHGHNHPEIIAAIHEQVNKLCAAGIPTELEVIFAEMLVRRFPNIDQIRFTSSGTEAVMMAIKAARAYTGRSKIAKIEGCYHGSYDFAEVSQSPHPHQWGLPNAPSSVGAGIGTPDSVLREVIVMPYNDTLSAEQILDTHGRELAAVLIDPAPPQIGFQTISRDFLSLIESKCEQYDSLLIFDEACSARTSYNGCQGLVNARPHLTALGKFVGGGIPLGVVGGRNDVMAVFDPRHGVPKVPHGGTFNANPIALAAGRKCIELLNTTAYSRLNELGIAAREGLQNIANKTGVSATISGTGSMLAVTFGRSAHNPIRTFRDVRHDDTGLRMLSSFHRHMLDNGVLCDRGGHFLLSTAMTMADVEQMIEKSEGAFRTALQSAQKD